MQPGVWVELMTIGLVAVGVVLPFWKLFSRMGFPGWISLAMVIPVLNLIVLYYAAFARWPASQGTGQRDPAT